ncbi:hypothetical protein [Butyrivibrio sp. XPD2002]|uniref:hypothetical protein n=1 Tax=Butyrivibrio sp. XPD2002 TaxID=1280665 RepID=UPI000426DF0C|nr:hypothetical protein [Butyrivibrio sp. XPD2002]
MNIIDDIDDIEQKVSTVICRARVLNWISSYLIGDIEEGGFEKKEIIDVIWLLSEGYSQIHDELKDIDKGLMDLSTQ